ncbi:MAG: hypothetical protein ABWX67_03265 [Allosphingosinicella sp.]
MSIPARVGAGLAICAALAATTPEQARAAAGYPLEAVLADARRLCAASPDVQVAAEGRLPAGWKVVIPHQGSWHDTYLKEYQRGPSRKDVRALAATVEGRSLEAVVVTVYGQQESTICEVVDRGAVFSPDDERMSRWAGRPPVIARKDRYPGLYGWTWSPGLDPASHTAVVNYATASAAESMGVRSGLTYLSFTLPRQTSK